MSSCISGGGRTYGFDLDIVKSPSTTTTTTSSRTSHSSSPSSTISESINSPLALSTRKPRTPRKRPNQTYNEAAALLSTVYPNIFSNKNLKKPSKSTKHYSATNFTDDFSLLIPPSPGFNNVDFLLHQTTTPEMPQSKPISNWSPCQSSSPRTDSEFQVNPWSHCDEEDFDAESILDEEFEEGIDSIMGNLSVQNDSSDNSNTSQFDPFCWHPRGGLALPGKFDLGIGINGGISAIRQSEDVDWWRFPTVDVLAISPRLKKAPIEKKKKKIERVEELKNSESSKDASISCKSETNSNSNSSSELNLFLKLNYETVLKDWSDKGSPFSDDILGTESSESDAIARLAQIDLFPENGGVREASVLRYREKRRSRLFSKKIRYQVRKVNADRRPRMKGRFVRRPASALREEK